MQSRNGDDQLGLEDTVLLAELRAEEKKLKEKRERAEARVRSGSRPGDPQEKPKIGRPKKNKPVPSVLGKRKRPQKPRPKKKKSKKSSEKPKNQPSISLFFSKVKK